MLRPDSIENWEATVGGGNVCSSASRCNYTQSSVCEGAFHTCVMCMEVVLRVMVCTMHSRGLFNTIMVMVTGSIAHLLDHYMSSSIRSARCLDCTYLKLIRPSEIKASEMLVAPRISERFGYGLL